MIVKSIGHIGIAANNCKEVAGFFEENFGAKVISQTNEESQKLISTMVKLGDGCLEIMESTSPDGVVAKYIEKKGEGFHHFSLSVCNIESLLKSLQGKGIRIVGKDLSDPKAKFAFINPKDAHGILIELVEYCG